jgi:hypothetical protein
MVSILLNESLASTNPAESLYMAQDIVRLLRRLGVRAMFATHLHELAADVAALHVSTAGESLIVSLVASRMGAGEDGLRRSYKIAPGPPLGRSYARALAAQYGQYQRLAFPASFHGPLCIQLLGCAIRLRPSMSVTVYQYGVRDHGLMHAMRLWEKLMARASRVHSPPMRRGGRVVMLATRSRPLTQART